MAENPIRELLEAIKEHDQLVATLQKEVVDQDKRILVLEKHVYVLLQRLEQNETSWFELSEKIAKSTIKLDSAKLSEN
jgi:phage shock protein A